MSLAPHAPLPLPPVSHSQSVAQALPGKSLIALVAHTALSQPSQGAATRGFTGRPLGSVRLSDGGTCSQPLTLAPWSDVSSDAQLSLLLLVIGLCDQDAASFVELGVEELAQKVRGWWNCGSNMCNQLASLWRHLASLWQAMFQLLA